PPWSRTRCSTRLSHSPTCDFGGKIGWNSADFCIEYSRGSCWLLAARCWPKAKQIKVKSSATDCTNRQGHTDKHEQKNKSVRSVTSVSIRARCCVWSSPAATS